MVSKKQLVTNLFLGAYVLTLISGIIYNALLGYKIGIILVSSLQGLGAILIIFCFPLAEKVFKIEIGSFLRILILSFAYCALYLGGMFDFYSLIPAWDIILHFTSGIIFTFVAFVIVRNLFLHDLPRKKTYTLSIIVAVLVSCTIANLWEIFEFVCDSLFHGNAQRFIPEIDGIYNGGNSELNLVGDKDTIYNFFVQPSGYRYALIDTMYDMIVCLAGTILTTFGLILAYRFNNDESIDYLLYKEQKETD